jgi:CarD family transcriptional regulator
VAVIRGGAGAQAPRFENAWSRRCRVNRARLDSGEVAQIAAVVRELSEVEAARGLSALERRMLATARAMLG